MPFDDNDRTLLHSINDKLDRLGRGQAVLFRQSQKTGAETMRDLDAILSFQDETLAKVRRNRDYDASIAELVKGQKQTITDLKGQLDAAVQANDMTKVQAISDKMDEISAAIDEDEAVSAVNENAAGAAGTAGGVGGQGGGAGGPAAGGQPGPAAGATS